MAFKMKKPTFGKKSPLKQVVDAESIGSKIAGYASRNKGVSRVLAPIAITSSLWNMYKSGQEHSGGRTGYEKNPNWDGVVRSGDDRFGGGEGYVNDNGEFVRDDGTAQFRRSYTTNAIDEKERRWKNKQNMLKSQEESKLKEKNRRAKNQLATDKRKHEAIDHKQRNNPDYGPHENEFHDYPGSNAYLKRIEEEKIEKGRIAKEKIEAEKIPKEIVVPKEKKSSKIDNFYKNTAGKSYKDILNSITSNLDGTINIGGETITQEEYQKIKKRLNL